MLEGARTLHLSLSARVGEIWRYLAQVAWPGLASPKRLGEVPPPSLCRLGYLLLGKPAAAAAADVAAEGPSLVPAALPV